MGSATFAGPEAWAEIAEKSEAAAKRELLRSSADLTDLDRLERAARQAQEAATAKARELNAAYDWTI